jgi:hypothetical protein
MKLYRKEGLQDCLSLLPSGWPSPGMMHTYAYAMGCGEKKSWHRACGVVWHWDSHGGDGVGKNRPKKGPGEAQKGRREG